MPRIERASQTKLTPDWTSAGYAVDSTAEFEVLGSHPFAKNAKG